MWIKNFLFQVCFVEVRACSSLHSPDRPLWQSSYLGLLRVGITCINHLIPFSCMHFMPYSLSLSHLCITHVLRLLVPWFLLCSGVTSQLSNWGEFPSFKPDVPFLSANVNSCEPTPLITILSFWGGLLTAGPSKVCGGLGLVELLTIFEHIRYLHHYAFLTHC